MKSGGWISAVALAFAFAGCGGPQHSSDALPAPRWACFTDSGNQARSECGRDVKSCELIRSAQQVSPDVVAQRSACAPQARAYCFQYAPGIPDCQGMNCFAPLAESCAPDSAHCQARRATMLDPAHWRDLWPNWPSALAQPGAPTDCREQ